MRVVFFFCLLPCAIPNHIPFQTDGSHAQTWMVSPNAMNQNDGFTYCSANGMTLAAIYTEWALTGARMALSAAGATKAITSAMSSGDGDGWRWGPTGTRWLDTEFPLMVPSGTGHVSDQRNGMTNGCYSLQASGSVVWDADGQLESHRVLCMQSTHRPPPSTPAPISVPQISAECPEWYDPASYVYPFCAFARSNPSETALFA